MTDLIASPLSWDVPEQESQGREVSHLPGEYQCTGAVPDLRLKLEDAPKEVDARLVLIGEGVLLMALPPLRERDSPVLAKRQQAERFVPFAVEAVER